MSAVFSNCGRYRYRLERTIGTNERGAAAAIIMVNPSTADASENDHTISKLIGFANVHGWGRIIVGNLFAYCAKDVRALAVAEDPVGPLNDRHLASIVDEAGIVLVAWGPLRKQPRAYRGLRTRRFLSIAAGRPLWSFGEPAQCGQPCHPLTLGYDRPLLRWSPPHHERGG